MIEHKTIEPETKTAIVMSRGEIDALRRFVDLIAGGECVIRLEPASEPEPALAWPTAPEPAPEPAWPTAPHVWWEGEVWVRGDDGEYQTAGDYWAKSHLDSTVQPVRDCARRFVREAVPVTLVPTEAWEEWKSWAPSEAVRACAGDRELVNAVDSLAQEVAR